MAGTAGQDRREQRRHRLVRPRWRGAQIGSKQRPSGWKEGGAWRPAPTRSAGGELRVSAKARLASASGGRERIADRPGPQRARMAEALGQFERTRLVQGWGGPPQWPAENL